MSDTHGWWPGSTRGRTRPEPRAIAWPPVVVNVSELLTVTTDGVYVGGVPGDLRFHDSIHQSCPPYSTWESAIAVARKQLGES